MGILSLIYMLLALVAELLLCRPGGPVLVSLSLCYAAVPWRCALSCGALCQIPQRAESRLRCGTRGTGNSQTGQSCLQTSSLCCTSKHFTPMLANSRICKMSHDPKTDLHLLAGACEFELYITPSPYPPSCHCCSACRICQVIMLVSILTCCRGRHRLRTSLVVRLS